MGIFARRNIQKHEELTFNYNVDRYGYVCVFEGLANAGNNFTQTDIKHKNVFVENPTVSGSLVERLKPILLPWTISIWTLSELQMRLI